MLSKETRDFYLRQAEAQSPKKVGDEVRIEPMLGTVVATFADPQTGLAYVAARDAVTGNMHVYPESMFASAAKPVAEAPAPDPKVSLPFEMFVPVYLGTQASNSEPFRRVRERHLPAKMRQDLYEGDVRVQIEFRGSAHSGDIDNLSKRVLDCVKGAVIADDRQVQELSCRYDKKAGSNIGFWFRVEAYA